ncbi:MAG TPA: ABC transporter substrate-binding protein [Chloroflexota bacterium]|nr:ABC transporter substrate-binding protein [Chloroflexota bacterium]
MIARLRTALPLLVTGLMLATIACTRGAAPPAGTAGQPAPPGAAQSGGASAPAPASGAATAAPIPITIAFSQVAAAFAPVWIAQDQGLFRKYGLDADVRHLAKPADIQSLVSGDVQITVDGSAAIDAIASGADLTYIASPVPVYTQGVFGDPSLHTLSDLVGKTVGVTSQGGSSDNALRTLFMKQGIDPSQVNLTYLREDGAILAALQTGQVQAAILTSPNTLRARQAGFNEIVNMTPLDLQTINNGIVVRRDWAQAHEDEVSRFLKAYIEAIYQARTNPDATKAIISKYTQVTDPELLEESYQNSLASWVVYPLMRDENVQNVIDLSSSPEVKAHKPSDYYDNSYLRKLQAFAHGVDPQGVPAAP